MHHNARSNGGADRGSISLWIAVMAAAVLVTLVLIVDGGAKIRAGNRADIAAAWQWAQPSPTWPKPVSRGQR